MTTQPVSIDIASLQPGDISQEGVKRSAANERVMRADLHVHSYHSGYASHMRFLRARDCYSEPEQVYRVAKARGMDVVTLTDHDSIDGCLEFLDRHPDAADFFISEEIECMVPLRPGARTGFAPPLKVHIGAYGIDERIHREIQPLRGSVYDATAYLREQGVFYTLNHLFFFLRRQMTLDASCSLLTSAILGLRGAQRHHARGRTIRSSRSSPTGSERGAAIAVGGSDAHTLAGRGHDLYRSARTQSGRVPAESAGRVGHRRRTAWRHPS